MSDTQVYTDAVHLRYAREHGSVKGLPDVPAVDSAPARQYRDVPVRTVDLPAEFVESAGGAFTRKGTPRLDVLCAARAAFLQRKSDAAETDALQMHSGAYAVREEGTFIKSIQGFAEDVSRRIYKRPVPEGDPLDDPEFSRLYRRMQASLRRSDLLEDKGPAVPDPDKTVRDRYGKRWALSGDLQDAQRGRPANDPPPFVRCTGPNVDGEKAEAAGVWDEVERRVAREEELHEAFTKTITARELRGKRWTADGRRFERRYAREGSDAPRYRTIGQWRPEAVGHRKRREQAVRVPWIVAEIDGRGPAGEKDRARSDRLARRLLRRLRAFGLDLSDVLVSYSGNASIHVRIPDGAIGCPLYRSSRDAVRCIERFFRRLCGRDEALFRAIDSACFRPGQLIRAVGSIHEATGRRTVAATADVYLSKPACFLWRLSEPDFQYTAPDTYPMPRRTAYVPALARLISPSKGSSSREKGSSSREGDRVNVSQTISPPECVGTGSVMDRVGDGVREGELWGLDVGRPECAGRNWAALFVAHDALRSCGSNVEAWRALLRWNGANDPPLGREELRGVFEKARRWRRGRVP